MKECSQCSEKAVEGLSRCPKHVVSGKEASRRMREKKKALGKCYQCEDDAVAGGTRCLKHASVRNQDYLQRAKSGVCINCPAPALSTGRQCQECKTTMLALKKVRVTKAKESGTCPNHLGTPVIQGKTICLRCRWFVFESAIKKYDGLTLEAYAWMEHEQNRCCASCGDQTELVVDHNHATGRVRALLCGPCNRLIGHAKEEISRLTAAIWYLQKFTSGPR